MIKQSGFDAGLAAVAFLLLTRRSASADPGGCDRRHRRGARSLVGFLSASDQGNWWYAMVTYRGQGDSILSGSVGERWRSVPGVAGCRSLKADAALFLLAAYGWRTSPLLARLWLAAAAIGVLGGGNFHNHYYLQLGAAAGDPGRVGRRARDRAALAAWSPAPRWGLRSGLRASRCRCGSTARSPRRARCSPATRTSSTTAR